MNVAENLRKNTLTRKQQHLVKELEQLAALFGMDYIIGAYDPEARTTYLELAKNKLIHLLRARRRVFEQHNLPILL